MSFDERVSPFFERLYEPLSLFATIPDSTSSWSRSVSILVFASQIFFLISVNVCAPSSIARKMNIVHFFPIRVKRAVAFGHVHWGVFTIGLVIYKTIIVNFFSKAKNLHFSEISID